MTIAGIAALMLAGCSSDVPSGILEDAGRLNDGTVTARSPMLSSTSGSTYSLTDMYGTIFAINEETHVITLSTGEWVTLDAVLSDQIVAELEGINETDAQRAELWASANDYDPLDCKNGENCETLRANPAPTRGQIGNIRFRMKPGGPGGRLNELYEGSTPPQKSSPILRRTTTSPSSSLGNFGGGTVLQGTTSRFSTSMPVLNFGPNPCSEILNSVLAVAQGFGWQRESILGSLKAAVIGEVIARGAGALVTAGSATGASLTEIVVNGHVNRLQVAIVATVWNQLGCATQTVRAGPFVRTGGGTWTPSEVWTWSCGWEDWEISFDGGVTWSPVEVWVCIRKRPEDS